MLSIEDAIKSVAPGPKYGLYKRVEEKTGIGARTLRSWINGGVERMNYPSLLLVAILEVLAERDLIEDVLSVAKNRMRSKE